MADLMITDRTMQALQKSLDLRERKQQVIAGNIANIDTPGYAARKFDFEADLRKAIAGPETPARTTHPKHLSVGAGGIDGVQGTLSRDIDRSGFGDGNSVDLDGEMLELAENQLLYEAGARMLKRKLAILKYAAGDGR